MIYTRNLLSIVYVICFVSIIKVFTIYFYIKIFFLGFGFTDIIIIQINLAKPF